MKKIAAIVCSVAMLSLLGACSKVEVPETPAESPVVVPVETPAEETPVETPVESPAEIPEEKLLHRYEDVQPGLSPLTGLPDQGEGKVIMVQMENTKAARPHSGLSEAGLIYEMEVESTITRLTTFFHGSYPVKAGPVRSARKQHMFLWSEWNYLYVFFGGSRNVPGQDIDEWREQLGITAKRLDGTKVTTGFSRSQDRVAPHNAYTNLDYVLKNAYDFEPVDRTLAYLEHEVAGGEKAEKISFSYRSDNQVTYEYHEEEGLYYRAINGEPMMDKESKKQIAVRNVILQHARHFSVKDTVYTNIDLIGSGEAEFFMDGQMFKGTWVRENEAAMTRYLDLEGKEVALLPGKTFIQILRPDTPVSFE